MLSSELGWKIDIEIRLIFTTEPDRRNQRRDMYVFESSSSSVNWNICSAQHSAITDKWNSLASFKRKPFDGISQ